MHRALLALGVIAVALIAASSGPASPAGVWVCVSGALTATTAAQEAGAKPAYFIKGAVPTGAQPNVGSTGCFACTLPSGAVRMKTTDGILGTPGYDATADSEGDLIWYAVPDSTLIYPAYTMS